MADPSNVELTRGSPFGVALLLEMVQLSSCNADSRLDPVVGYLPSCVTLKPLHRRSNAIALAPHFNSGSGSRTDFRS
jgi:hypothetical protein